MTAVYVMIAIGLVLGASWLGIRALKRKLATAAGEMSSLLLEGEATTAQIVAAEKRRMSRGEFEYFVTYAFRSRDDAEHNKEFRVSATEFDDYREGQPIDIVYLPRDPAVSATHAMVARVRNTSHGHTGAMT